MSALWTASAFILAALPTGSVVYILANKYNYYIDRSAKVILYTTFISLISLTLCFFIVELIWPGLIQPHI